MTEVTNRFSPVRSKCSTYSANRFSRVVPELFPRGSFRSALVIVVRSAGSFTAGAGDSAPRRCSLGWTPGCPGVVMCTRGRRPVGSVAADRPPPSPGRTRFRVVPPAGRRFPRERAVSPVESSAPAPVAVRGRGGECRCGMTSTVCARALGFSVRQVSRFTRMGSNRHRETGIPRFEKVNRSMFRATDSRLLRWVVVDRLPWPGVRRRSGRGALATTGTSGERERIKWRRRTGTSPRSRHQPRTPAGRRRLPGR